MLTESSSDETIDQIKDRSNKIVSIFSFITELSSQTNLLAVNTSIQAAKIGADGQGFQVIANELRKLSEQSKISLEEIGNLLNQLSEDATRLKTAKEENQAIKQTLKRIESQNELFNSIMNEIEDKIEVKDGKLRYYMINNAGLEDYGVSKDEIIGKSMFDFFHEEVAAGYADKEREIIQKRSMTYSLEKVHINDTSKYLFINKTALFLPEENEWGLLVIQREVNQSDLDKPDFLEILKRKYKSLTVNLSTFS